MKKSHEINEVNYMKVVGIIQNAYFFEDEAGNELYVKENNFKDRYLRVGSKEFIVTRWSNKKKRFYGELFHFKNQREKAAAYANILLSVLKTKYPNGVKSSKKDKPREIFKKFDMTKKKYKASVQMLLGWGVVTYEDELLKLI